MDKYQEIKEFNNYLRSKYGDDGTYIKEVEFQHRDCDSSCGKKYYEKLESGYIDEEEKIEPTRFGSGEMVDDIIEIADLGYEDNPDEY